MGESHRIDRLGGSTAIADDPGLVAHLLACYQRAHQVDDQAIAAELGIPPGTLDDFRRCSRPWPDPYAVELSRLAAAFGVDVRALSRILASG